MNAALEQLLRGTSMPIPSPLTAIAMLDTGASGTVLQAGLIGPLGLSPVGTIGVQTPTTTTPVQCPVYAVRVVFPGTIGAIEVVVTEAPLHGQHIQALIGRDILQHAVFVYLGVANGFTLSF